MAQRSPWLDFANAFNATYDTIGRVSQDISTARAASKQFMDAAGSPLQGAALDNARTQAIADVKYKYGDVEGAMGLRSGQAALEAKQFQNDLNNATRTQQAYVLGDGAVEDLRAGIAGRRASTAASMASVNRMNTLLPYEVEQERLRVDGQRLDNSAKGLRVTSDTAALTRQQTDDQIIADIIKQSAQREFPSIESANAAVSDAIARAPISPQARAQAIEAISTAGVSTIGMRAADITRRAGDAYKERGLDGVADLYDSVKDGARGRVVRENGVVSVMLDRGDGNEEVIASAQGQGAEEVVAARVMEMFADPATALLMARSEVLAQRAGLSESQAKPETEYRKGLSNIMGSADFAYAQPEEQQQIISLYNNQFQTGLSGRPAAQVAGAPYGIDPSIWESFSETQRQGWLRLTPQERAQLIGGGGN